MGLTTLAHDMKRAARGLRRAPGFTATAVIALGLALGADLAVFAVVNSVLLAPLPYPASGRLVALRQWAPGAGAVASAGDGLGLSASMYLTYAEHNRSFSAMGVWATPGGAIVTGEGRPERVRVAEVSFGALQALAVAPQLGRWFGAQDENPHGAATVMLSYGYWQERFGGDRGVLGRQLILDKLPRTIVGVMPSGFQLPETDAALLLPIRIEHSGLKLTGFGLQGLARLRPGVSVPEANRDLQGLVEVWMNSWSNGPGIDPHFYRRWHITPALQSLQAQVTEGVSGGLWAILATVGLVMLIAGANVVNLFLVRAEARQTELAVRAALGAGRARLFQNLLLESGLVAAASLGLGWAWAEAALAWLRAHGPGNLPRLDTVTLDGRVALVGGVLALAVALLAALAPGWRAKSRLADVLGGEGQGAGASRERRRMRNLLGMVQLALALVLLVASGLMLRSMAALHGVDSGVADPAGLEYFRLSIPGDRNISPTAIVAEQRTIQQHLAAIPGVRSAAWADQLPMQYSPVWDTVVRRGEVISPANSPPARAFYFISPGYLDTAGIRLVAGRDFSWTDLEGRRPYVVISAGLARAAWGGPQAAIGKELSASGPGEWNEVIGVADDVRSNGIAQPAPATVYWPVLRAHLGDTKVLALNPVTMILRTPRAGSAGLLADIQKAVGAADPELPVYTVGTMAGLEAASQARTAFTMIMLTLAGGMALLLGVVGLYGVIAYDVERRRREIGIRLALGADRGSVLRLFVSEGLRLSAVGGAAGLLLAGMLSQFLRSQLYGVTALDPLTYAAAALLLIATVGLASYVPARRAAGEEAARILRQ